MKFREKDSELLERLISTLYPNMSVELTTDNLRMVYEMGFVEWLQIK